MIIGFDGKRAVSNMTGLGNYSRLVIERVAMEIPLTGCLCIHLRFAIIRVWRL